MTWEQQQPQVKNPETSEENGVELRDQHEKTG